MPIDIRAQQGLTPPESPVEGLGKIFALKNMQQEQQLRQAQLGLHQQEFQQKQQQYQDQQDAQRVLDAALQQATTRDQIRDYFTSRGKGHLWLPVSKSLDAADEAKAKVDHLKAQIGELQDKHTLARQEWWASQATGLQKLDPEDWPAAIPRVLASAVHSGIEDENTVRQMWGRALENPEEIPGLIKHLAGSSQEALKARTAVGARPRPELSGEVRGANGELIPGTLEYNPGEADPTKRYTLDGKPLPEGAHVEHATPKSAAPPEQDTDTLADMLLDGLAVPSQLSKRGINTVIAAASRKSVERGGEPLNLAKLQLEYDTAKRFMSTMNDQQNLNFNRLGLGIHSEIDRVQKLADELKQGGVQKWNAAKRSTIMQVWGNSPQSETATRYMSALTGLQSLMAQFEAGGYAAQVGSWDIAKQQLNSDYGVKDMTAALDEIKRQVGFRLKAQADSRPIMPGGGGNQFAPPPQAPTGAPPPPAAGKMVPMVAKDAQGNYTRKLLVPEDEVSAAEKAGAKRQ